MTEREKSKGIERACKLIANDDSYKTVDGRDIKWLSKTVMQTQTFLKSVQVACRKEGVSEKTVIKILSWTY